MKLLTLALMLTVLLGCAKQAPQAAESRPMPSPPVVSVAGATFSRDRKLLLTSYRIEHVDKQLAMPKRLVLWEVASGKKVWTADAPETLFPIAFLVGNEAVLLYSQHFLQIWGVNKAEPLRTFAQDPSDDIYCAALSSDGSLALVGKRAAKNSPAEYSLELWDIAGAKRVCRFTATQATIRSVVFSPDGKLALSAHTPTNQVPAVVNLWDLATGLAIRSFSTSELWGGPVAFLPDGKSAMCLKGENNPRRDYIVLWDVATGNEVRRLPNWGEAVAFTPDGQRLVIGESTGTLMKVDVASGRLLWNRDFHSKTGGVKAFAFSGDGKLALTATGIYSAGGGVDPIKLRLWDLTNGEVLRILTDPPWAM